MKTWKEKLKPHLLPAGLIVFGAMLLAIIWRIEGNIPFIVGIIGALLIIAGLFTWANLLKSQQIAANPYYDDDLVYDNRWEKWMHYLSGGLLVTGFLGLQGTRFWTGNLLSELTFFMVWGIAGVLVATAGMKFIKKRKQAWFIDNETREKEIICIWLGLVFWTVLAAIGLTFGLPPASERMEKLQITRHGENEKNDKAYIWVKMDGKEIKLRPNNEDWKALIGSDSTLLVINKSIFGFEYTCEMLPNDNQHSTTNNN